MKIKTSELTGPVLNWAVAKCDKRIIGFNLGGGLEVRGRTEDGAELPKQWDLWMPWHPSTDWAQGGPIIDQERIATFPIESAWRGTKIGEVSIDGPTPLIAAMRCFVASRLGNEVDVPEELS